MAYLPSDNPSSLVAWFRMGVGVTVTGAGVSKWADQSGNGNDLLQATNTNRPAYDGSAIITFDGVDNFLKCTAFTLNQPTQVSILANPVTWKSNGFLTDGNTLDTLDIAQFTATPNILLYAGAFGPSNTGATLGSFHAITALFSGASSTLKVDASTAATGNAGTNNAGGFRLGSSNGGNFGNWQVKEIIIRNVDDATIRANDHQYLIDLQSDVVPVVDFSGTPLTGSSSLSVAFTDLSTNSPRDWSWDFGDGNTSTSQNPTNIYASAGTYTVTLTATNYAGSDAEVKTGYITVTAPSVATPTGGKGDNERRKRVTFKPTGLLDRPVRKVKAQKPETGPSKEDVEKASQVAEIAKSLADESRAVLKIQREKEASDILKMSEEEVDAEIAVLLKAKLKKNQDARVILLLLAS